MKFRILLQDSEKKILFDPEQALSFEGETGPYLQYTYARISSIVRKFHEIHSEVQISPETIDYTLLDTPEDKQLLLQLSCFSEEIQKAAQTYKSNYVARYCLNIAQLFNSYYHHHKIMDEHNKHLTQARLALIQGVQQVLVNGFALLGIEKVENM
ncbi:MAG: hypothetical protein LBP53_07550 [Candidatus Peribacteria bacterium]|nr:hypothetical protein [Candidatus Peribacteria bacterium]